MNSSDPYPRNKEILSILSEYLENNKDKNFIESLYNLGIIPIISRVSEMYYEKPEETIQRINKVKLNGHI